MARALVLLLLLGACDQPKLAGTTTTPTSPAATAKSMDTHISMATFSVDISFALGKGGVPGTITTPKDDGPWPAVVLLDDSAASIAADLAKHGMVVLRYDRAGTGKSAGPATPTADDFRAEAVAALKYLRSRPDVRGDRVFLVGRGESAIHAQHAAAVDGKVAGVALIAAPPELGDDPVKLTVPVLRETGTSEPGAPLDEATVKKLVDWFADQSR